MVTFDQALPALLIALPVAGSCVLLACGRVVPRLLIDVIGTGTALAGTVLAGWLLYETGTGTVTSWSGGWEPRPGLTVGIVLVADRLGAAMALLIALLTTTALLFGWHYFDNLHAHYPALVLLFATGMTGFALTGDLFDMFVFFELMGVAAYALTGLKIEEPESVQAGLNFGVINSLGAYLCLFGIGLLYARTGQLGLAQLGTAVATRAGDALVLAAFVLIATGWLVKAPNPTAVVTPVRTTPVSAAVGASSHHGANRSRLPIFGNYPASLAANGTESARWAGISSSLAARLCCVP